MTILPLLGRRRDPREVDAIREKVESFGQPTDSPSRAEIQALRAQYAAGALTDSEYFARFALILGSVEDGAARHEDRTAGTA